VPQGRLLGHDFRRKRRQRDMRHLTRTSMCVYDCVCVCGILSVSRPKARVSPIL